MRLALYQPDIAQNAGTLLRLCACLGVAADIIGPAGFDSSDRAFRRAGLDYLAHVDLERHLSFDTFEAQRARAVPKPRLILLSTHADRHYDKFPFEYNDILMVGRESAGVPEAVRRVADARVCIPIVAGLRSLNVAVAAAIVLGEALRQTGLLPASSSKRSLEAMTSS
jgi:tRNA (cytidine/uridine-2'-O-)-methyltransferase